MELALGFCGIVIDGNSSHSFSSRYHNYVYSTHLLVSSLSEDAVLISSSTFCWPSLVTFLESFTLCTSFWSISAATNSHELHSENFYSDQGRLTYPLSSSHCPIHIWRLAQHLDNGIVLGTDCSARWLSRRWPAVGCSTNTLVEAGEVHGSFCDHHVDEWAGYFFFLRCFAQACMSTDCSTREWDGLHDNLME